MARLSTRFRALLCYLGVTLLAMLLAGVYLRGAIHREVVGEARQDADRLVHLAERLMRSEGACDSPGRFRTWAGALGAELDADISYLGQDGSMVLAPAPRSGAAGTDAGTEFITVRKDLAASGVLPAGTLRVDVPLRGVQERMARLGKTMSLAFLAALLLTGGLGFLLHRRMGRHLEEIMDVAGDIGRGDYTRRLRLEDGGEFGALARSVNSMARRIGEHIRIITVQRDQLEAVLEGMREGVMVLDANGRILSVNRAMLGIVPGARGCEGRRPLEVLSSPELQRACDQALEGAPDGTGSVSLQIEPVKDTVYDVNIVGLRGRSRLPDSDLGAVVVCHDISELSRLERVRRDFVANVSHELRTPLTSIKGYAETLLLAQESGAVRDEDRKSFLETIVRNADHMAKMTGDLLNLARLEGGGKPFEVGRVDAAECLAQAQRECAHLARDRGVVVQTDVGREPLPVAADPDRLTQVFRNLLENAVKYGPAGGGVRVAHQWREGMALFRVQDQGPGIPGQDRKRIFERFYRVEKHRGGHSSSGLGLAISKHIVERLGGAIWVETPEAPGEEETPGTATGPHGGSVFCFTVPAAPRPGPGEDVHQRAEAAGPAPA
jgi:two-component system phosphate regulon sensor histidine kinase PhoR